jgi:hypothetical protein
MDEMRIGSTDVLEADNYVAELIDYTDKKQDGTPLVKPPFQGEGEPKPQWRFSFELDDPAGHQLSAWVNKPADEANIHPKGKIVEMVRALAPDLAAGAEWSLDDLLHRRCRLQVEVFERADGTRGNKVSGFLPLRKGTDAAAARQPVAAAVPRRSTTAPTLDEVPPF